MWDGFGRWLGIKIGNLILVVSKTLHIEFAFWPFYVRIPNIQGPKAELFEPWSSEMFVVEPEARSLEVGAGSSKPGARSPEPGAWSPEPGPFFYLEPDKNDGSGQMEPWSEEMEP